MFRTSPSDDTVSRLQFSNLALIKEKFALNANVNCLNENIAQINAHNVVLSNEILDLKDKITQTSQTNTNILAKWEQLQSQFATLQQQNESLRTVSIESLKLKAHLKVLSNQIKTLEGFNEKLTKEKAALEIKYSEIVKKQAAQNYALKSAVDNLTKENAALDVKCKEQETKNHEQANTITRLEGELAELQESNKDKDRAIYNLKEHIEDLDNQYNRMYRGFSEANTKSNKALAQKGKEITSLGLQIDALKSQLDEVKGVHKVYIQAQQNEHVDSNKAYEKRIDALLEKLVEYQNAEEKQKAIKAQELEQQEFEKKAYIQKMSSLYPQLETVKNSHQVTLLENKKLQTTVNSLVEKDQLMLLQYQNKVAQLEVKSAQNLSLQVSYDALLQKFEKLKTLYEGQLKSEIKASKSPEPDVKRSSSSDSKTLSLLFKIPVKSSEIQKQTLTRFSDNHRNAKKLQRRK